jgi:hypothetical protein
MTPTDTPPGTAIWREFADLIHTTENYVVSNTIAPEDLPPWQDTTHSLRSDDLYAQIAALKARPGATSWCCSPRWRPQPSGV